MTAESLARHLDARRVGAAWIARGLALQNIDPEDYDGIAELLAVSSPLAREIQRAQVLKSYCITQMV
jgi:hypothetical protein